MNSDKSVLQGQMVKSSGQGDGDKLPQLQRNNPYKFQWNALLHFQSFFSPACAGFRPGTGDSTFNLLPLTFSLLSFQFAQNEIFQ